MNPLLRSAIRELKTEHGVTLDALGDLHHILRLKELADAVIRIQKDLRSEGLLHPVRKVGSATFRRLSVGALDFLNDEVASWYGTDSVKMAMSFAFCHAHAERPGLIWESRGQKRNWEKRIRKWRRSLGVSMPELLATLDDFQTELESLDIILEEEAAKPQADSKPHSESFGPLIDLLASQYPVTPPDGMTIGEWWIWRVPAEEIDLLVDAFLERQEAEQRRARKPGQAFATDPDKTFIRAHHALRVYMDAIVQEKEGTD
jgi:hypothetical protein